MTHQMLTDVLVDTFEEHVGKWQEKKPEADRRALKVTFRTRIDYDKEEGYRYMDLVVYAAFNYVSVYVRERWTVLDINDISDELDPSGENQIEEGKDYVDGSTEWRQIAHHDSGWRSAISSFLFENRGAITGFDRSGAKFYQVVTLPADIKVES